tara:strand:+ start:435 stop:1535 length:1101 start_codon:yes stop_codon:yes gene_type:complete
MISIFPVYSDYIKIKNQESPGVEYIKKRPSLGSYILGTGDTLSIVVSPEADSLKQTVTIDGEGTVFLSRLKRIYISGLSIDELVEILNEEYKNYVFSPDVNINIVEYRPIRVYVDGEIDNPGMHLLSGNYYPKISSNKDNTEDLNSNKSFENYEQGTKKPIYFPTIFDVIRKSNGITMNADLSKVKVIRIDNISNGGGLKETEVDLLKTLNLTDISQNLRIYDGDRIIIPKSINPVVNQIVKAMRSNINPKYIQVFVEGRVEKPGPIKVLKSSTLTDAITIGGGTKLIKGPVVFLRYDNEGEIDKRKFALNNSARRGSFKNPYLKNGDIIFVGKSLFNKSSEVIEEVSSPFTGILSTYALFKMTLF